MNDVLTSNNNVLSNRGYFEATIARTLAIIFDNNPIYEQYINMDDLKLSLAFEYFKEYEGAVA
jgi:hypothetical protein